MRGYQKYKESQFINDVVIAQPYKSDKERIRINTDLQQKKRRLGITSITNYPEANCIVYTYKNNINLN